MIGISGKSYYLTKPLLLCTGIVILFFSCFVIFLPQIITLQDSKMSPILTPGSWCGELSSPTVTIEAANIDNPLQPVTTETRRLNQTCATLFESLAPAEMSKTSIAVESQDHLVSVSSSVREESLQKVSGEKEEMSEETMEYHHGENVDRGESVETVAGDVIIIDNDVTGNNDSLLAHSSSVSVLRSSKSVVPMASSQEKLNQSVSISSEDFQSSLPPSGHVHVVYSHACARSSDVSPFEGVNEQSPKKTHASRPLSLRDAGASKVKWREVSSSSLPSTSGNSSNTKTPPFSPTGKAASRSDNDDAESKSTSSSPEQCSPSLLCASSSPWRLQQSNCSSSSSSRQQQQYSSSTPVNMIRSMLAKTPASSVIVTTPTSMLKSAIPASDSQFSLDLSQSAPLSPELCPSATPSLKPRPSSKGTPSSNASVKPPSKDTLSSVNPSQSGDCNVVPITPGVPTVKRILQGHKRWLRALPEPLVACERNDAVASGSYDEQTLVKRASSSKRGQDEIDFEDEDILPQSKVHRLSSINSTSDSQTGVDEDHTRLECEPATLDSSKEEEEDDCPMSPVLLYPKSTAAMVSIRAAAAANGSSDGASLTTQGQGITDVQSTESSPQKLE